MIGVLLQNLKIDKEKLNLKRIEKIYHLAHDFNFFFTIFDFFIDL